MKKNFYRISSLALILSLGMMFFPGFSRAAAYNYERTQIGAGGVSPEAGGDYRVNEPKLALTSAEEVWVLSRITGISDISRFRLRHEVLAGGTAVFRVLLSPVYNPAGSTWAKTYSYNNFGTLPAGNHAIRVSLSVDNGDFVEVDRVNISVSAAGDNYAYAGSATGLNVQPTGEYAYDIVNGQTAFDTNQSVYVLTKLANISNIETFRIRHQVLANGSAVYLELFSPLFNPGLSRWGVNHTWNQFGYLPAGSHVVTAAISVNGGAYKELERINISVSGASAQYLHEDTLTGLNVQAAGSYAYDIVNGQTAFSANDPVYVLTKLKDINNLSTFRVRHQVLAGGGALYRELYSPVFAPNLSRWNLNHTWNNFGQLPPGSHVITAAISVNGGAYKELERINISVSPSAQKYYFESTDLGTGVVSAGTYSYGVTDPRTSFSASENIHALTKLKDINSISTFRIKHQVLANGTTVYSELYSPVFSPALSAWNQTHTWTVFSPLPAGNHVLKTFISLDGGAYIELDSQEINIYQ